MTKVGKTVGAKAGREAGRKAGVTAAAAAALEMGRCIYQLIIWNQLPLH